MDVLVGRAPRSGAPFGRGRIRYARRHVAIRGRTVQTVFPGVDGSKSVRTCHATAELAGRGPRVSRRCRVARHREAMGGARPSPGTAPRMGTRSVYKVDKENRELLGASTRTGRVVRGRRKGSSCQRDPTELSGPAATRRSTSSKTSTPPISGQLDQAQSERRNVTYGEVTPLTSTEGEGGGRGGTTARASADRELARRSPATLIGRRRRGSSGTRERRLRVVVRRRRGTRPRVDRAHALHSRGRRTTARTGRAVDGGSPFEGGDGRTGGDILVGAHGGGLFALPSTDGGSARGLSLGARGFLGGVGALVPVAVSPTASDDDWACIPEKLWDDALTPGGLDSFLALHGGGARPSTGGSRYLLTPLQRVMGSPVGAAAVVTVAVGFGTFASHAASIARGKRRGGSNGGSNGSKRGSRGKNRGRRNKGKGGAGGGAGRGGDDAIDDRGRRRGSPDGEPRRLPRVSGRVSGATPERLRRGSRRPSQRRPGDPRLRFVRDDSVRGRAGRQRPVAVKRLLAQFHELARRAGDADLVG